MPSFMLDARKFFLITITIIAIIQIDIFGTLGLIAYGILILYGVAFIVINNRNLNIYTAPIFYVACAFYLYFILANCINGSFVLRGPSLVQYFLLCIVAFSLRSIESLKKDVKYFCFILTVLGLIQSVSSIVMALTTYYSPDFVSSLPSVIEALFKEVAGAFPIRGTGLIQNANLTGGYSFVCGIFSLYLFFITDNKKWKILAFINFILSFYLVFFFCASRTFMLALISSLFVFGILRICDVCKNPKNRMYVIRVLIALLVCAIMIFIAIFWVFPSAKDFLSDRVLRISSLSDGSGRLHIWVTALELGKGNRLFGYSYKNLENTLGYGNVHNSLLEMLSFGGVPTLVLFLIYFSYTLYIAVRILKRVTDLSVSDKLFLYFIVSYIIGYFVSGFTESDINRMKMTTLMFTIFLGYIHVVYYQLKAQNRMQSASMKKLL